MRAYVVYGHGQTYLANGQQCLTRGRTSDTRGALCFKLCLFLPQYPIPPWIVQNIDAEGRFIPRPVKKTNITRPTSSRNFMLWTQQPRRSPHTTSTYEVQHTEQKQTFLCREATGESRLDYAVGYLLLCTMLYTMTPTRASAAPISCRPVIASPRKNTPLPNTTTLLIVLQTACPTGLSLASKLNEAKW